MSTASAPPAPELGPGNPWPGLESFREGDAEFFHGRDDEAEELLRLLARERLSVLYGISGQGKSSLLQAGLFPTLPGRGLLPVYVRLVYGDGALPLGRQVLDALRAAAGGRGLEVPAFDPAATLWEHFHRRGAGFWSGDDPAMIPVLVLDQFEEAFTHGQLTPARAAETRDFLEELADLVEGRAPAEVRARLEADPRRAAGYRLGRHPYKVLLALREDYLAHLETLRGLMPSLMVNRMRLTPLSGRAALEVTAAGGDALLPPEVGREIVRRLGEPREGNVSLENLRVDPALLSLFCRGLNEERLRRGHTTITVGMVARERDTILRGFYEDSLTDLPSRVRVFVEDRLLIEGGAYRNTEALENARKAGITDEMLDRLVERRLIRRDEREGRTRIELTHDVLAPVVAESRDRRTSRVRLTRLTRIAIGLLVLMASAVGLMLYALGQAALARQREREALLQAELSTELLRLGDEAARRAVAGDSAAALLVQAAQRRAQVLERALCSTAAGQAAVETARAQLRDPLLCTVPGAAQ